MNTATLVIFLLPWPIWLAWELVLLWRRKEDGASVLTISMVAKNIRYQFTSVVYLFAGLLMHWFVPWRTATVWGSVTFWVVALALLVWDVVLSRVNPDWRGWPAWMRYARHPVAWLIGGAASGFFLFPQK